MQNLDCEESIMVEMINCDDLDLSDWESSSSDNTQILPLEHSFPSADISSKDNDIFSHRLETCLQERELGLQIQDSLREDARIFRRTEMLPHEIVGGNMTDKSSLYQTLSVQENSTYSIFSKLGNLDSLKINVARQTCSESPENISSNGEESDVDQCYERITSSQEMITSSQESFGSQRMATSSQETFDSQRMITSSQETFYSQRMITLSQETIDSQRMITSSQETFDSQRMITSSEEAFDSQKMITSSQETFGSHKMITSSQEAFDGQPMLTSSQESFGSQRMLTCSQESCNNHKTLTSGRKFFEEITEKEICSIGETVPQNKENSNQVIPLDGTKQSKIIKTKNLVSKALLGVSSCRRSEKSAKSKIIQRNPKVKKRKGGCKKKKISARELKGNKNT